jgi:hypothetical protein
MVLLVELRVDGVGEVSDELGCLLVAVRLG